MTENTHRYDDIINLPHHVSSRHPQMPRTQRAAQFAPFAALVTYGESIENASRFTDRRIELDENMRAELDIRMHDALESGLPVQIEFFVPDMQKNGGEYQSTTGSIAKIDEYEGALALDNGQRILLADIVGIRFQ